jgi:hypothetical protein
VVKAWQALVHSSGGAAHTCAGSCLQRKQGGAGGMPRRLQHGIRPPLDVRTRHANAVRLASVTPMPVLARATQTKEGF